jgi:SAM-dependent methyltransferase
LVVNSVSENLDIFGVAILDWARGGDEFEIFERDDGFFCEGDGRGAYLSPVRDWFDAERWALKKARGRVLDVGCGAGRVSLELQRRGIDVVGIDSSDRVVQAAREMGVENVWHRSIAEMKTDLHQFDTIVLYGNNFGMLGTAAATKKWFRSWAPLVNPDVRILAVSTSPYFGGAPCITRDYFHRNKALGELPGLLRYRYHYQNLVGPWWKWLFVSQGEMRQLLKGTGWYVESIISSKPSEPYVAVLALDGSVTPTRSR